MHLLFFNELNALISNMVNINKYNPPEQNSLWLSIIFKSTRRAAGGPKTRKFENY